MDSREVQGTIKRKEGVAIVSECAADYDPAPVKSADALYIDALYIKDA
jgi:hypothetical protein